MDLSPLIVWYPTLDEHILDETFWIFVRLTDTKLPVTITLEPLPNDGKDKAQQGPGEQLNAEVAPLTPKGSFYTNFYYIKNVPRCHPHKLKVAAGPPEDPYWTVERVIRRRHRTRAERKMEERGLQPPVATSPDGISSNPQSPISVGRTFQIAGTVDPSSSSMSAVAGCYSGVDHDSPHTGTPVNPPPEGTDWAFTFGPVEADAKYGILIQAVAGGETTYANYCVAVNS